MGPTGQAGQYKLVTYWFWTEEGYVEPPSALLRTTNAVAAWEKLRNANHRGALFLCYVDVERPEDLGRALATQRDFAEGTLPHVDRVLRQPISASEK